MAGRKNFRNRIKARRLGALERLENMGEKFLPEDNDAKQKKIEKRKEEIRILKERI